MSHQALNVHRLDADTPTETAEVDESAAPGFSGYRNFMGQLAKETEPYKGRGFKYEVQQAISWPKNA